MRLCLKFCQSASAAGNDINDRALVTKLYRLDMAWKKSSDHPDGAPGETRLTFDSAVLSVDWSSSAQCSKTRKKCAIQLGGNLKY